MGDLIRSAFIGLGRGGWRAAACLVLWIGVEFANAIGQRLADPVGWLLGLDVMAVAGDAVLPASQQVSVLTYLVGAGFQDLFSCVFIAALLRIILIGRAGPWRLGRCGLMRAAGAVLTVSLAATLILNGPSILFFAVSDRFGADESQIGVRIAISFLFILVLICLAARLCLVYPSAAVGQGWDLRRNWQRTSGNGLRLSAVFVLLMLVFTIVSTFTDMAIYRLTELNDPDPFSPWGWAVMTKVIANRIVIMTALLAVGAVAFTRLTEYPAARIPGSCQSPEQFAMAFE